MGLQHCLIVFAKPRFQGLARRPRMMAVKEKRGAFGVALQAVFDDATVDAFMDVDFSRFASLVQADLFLQQFPEDGFLALGTFSPAFRVAAFPRLESMGTRGFSVSAVGPLLEQPFSLPGFGHFRLRRLAEDRAAATSSKVWPVAFRIASRLVKSCQ